MSCCFKLVTHAPTQTLCKLCLCTKEAASSAAQDGSTLALSCCSCAYHRNDTAPHVHPLLYSCPAPSPTRLVTACCSSKGSPAICGCDYCRGRRSYLQQQPQSVSAWSCRSWVAACLQCTVSKGGMLPRQHVWKSPISPSELVLHATGLNRV